MLLIRKIYGFYNKDMKNIKIRKMWFVFLGVNGYLLIKQTLSVMAIHPLHLISVLIVHIMISPKQISESNPEIPVNVRIVKSMMKRRVHFIDC